ncbi:MAG: hypothetical protein QM831_44420 [Kofleriaceae bacterium]
MVEPSPPPPRVTIVVAERGDHGIHLVDLDERGDRQFEVVRAADQQARDTDPTISPDGKWIVFASSRGRPIAETNLWIAPLAPDAIAVPLTTGPQIDSHPTWRTDGRAIVFASTRAGHEFDLFELRVGDGRAIGDVKQLTTAAGNEITPSVARDGTIYYAAVRVDGSKVTSRIEARHVDGSIEAITEGPGDASPAISPDGTQLAYSRPAVHETGPDGELFVVSLTHGDPEPIVDVRLTDETGPVWSRDGRYVFATSVLRSASGAIAFSSVIAVDLTQHPRVARVLEDRTGAIARITPAIAPVALDAAILDANPEYLSELARITAKAAAARDSK